MLPTAIAAAIRRAAAGEPADLPEVPGFSSPRVRRLLNLLCRELDARYLEIGTHIGSTLIPALWGNPHVAATCIDNWTLAQEPKTRADLEANLTRWLPGRPITIIEDDMFMLDVARVPAGVTVFFYDGPHDRAGQYQAFVRFQSCFAPQFVALVDDWNWAEPREETARALRDLHYRVVTEWVLPGDYNGSAAQWWNGLYVALIAKP